MQIVVASKNQVKIDAVKETLQSYDFLKSSKVEFKEVSSEVSHQPKSLEETVKGAMNRARAAFSSGLSFGIEDGLMAVPHTKTGFMNVCVCAIYDGKDYHLGLSSAFEYPVEVVKLLQNGLDVNQAFYKLELTKKEKLGNEEGAIGILTKGKSDRKHKTAEAVKMALIHLQNEELYRN